MSQQREEHAPGSAEGPADGPGPPPGLVPVQDPAAIGYAAGLGVWPRDAEELVAAQRQLAAATPPPWKPGGDLLVAGAWVCFDRLITGRGAAGDRAWAAAVAMRGSRIVEPRDLRGEAAAAYDPGLLALRLGALCEAVLRGLAEQPDVVLVDATGRDHPRGAGLALHLGAVLDVPTVGVTHRPLLAGGAQPPDTEGATTPLLLDDVVVGHWLRTRAGTRPVAVHAGWRTDPGTAVEVVRSCLHGHRTPEPLREARRRARRARARDRGELGR